MEIWLKQDGERYRFPVVPPSYEVTSGITNTAVNVNSFGEINLVGKRSLKIVPLSSFFPKQKYDFCQYTIFPTPKESVKLIEKMKNKGVLRLTITGTPVNMTCTIENFVWGQDDATGDIHFSIDFKEYRKPKLKQKKKKEKVSSKILTPIVDRQGKTASDAQYVVKDIDTICSVAKNATGTSANWKAIYEQNKKEIGDNPMKLTPGQRLVIKI